MESKHGYVSLDYPVLNTGVSEIPGVWTIRGTNGGVKLQTLESAVRRKR